MEGDAGARRLNPTDADEITETNTEVVGPAVTSSAAETTVEDPSPTAKTALEPMEGADPEFVARGPSRLGRGWLIGITAALLVLAGGIGAGGYFALRSHLDSEAVARNDAAAMQAAEDCVAATQAPNTAAMADSARKIIECSTGDFGAQAAFYSGLLVEAYQAANVQVQVSDMRAAVERNNSDGSIELLVALRVKVTNIETANQEQGYRLRVKMTRDQGQYKISKLEQVSK